MAKKKAKFQIALLNADNVLVGFKPVNKLGPEDVDVGWDCDLSVDKRYKWDEEAKTFVPLGHGFGKPARPPISECRVLYLLAKHAWDDVPAEVQDWCRWYETNMAKQEEEISSVKGRGK